MPKPAPAPYRHRVDNVGKRKRPKEPTAAVQGSEDKVNVLAERLARGEPLWYPSDGASLA
jgi:hypothetical protein